MANTAQSAKRARQAETRRRQNQILRSRLRTEVRKAREITLSDNVEEKKKAFISMQSMVDRSVTKGILLPRTAARIKSRINNTMRPAAKPAAEIAAETAVQSAKPAQQTEKPATAQA